MKLTDELKKKIDNFFDNKTEEELQYIAEKYQALQLQQTGVSSCFPFKKGVFYVLFNEENKDFFHSKTDTHTFSAPLILDAMIFKNKELAIKYNSENKLKGFSIVKVIPQYFLE
jgi:hypothetical protein